jgi:hypothetical protein
MTADFEPPEPAEPTRPLVVYTPAEADIRALAVKFKGLPAQVETPQGYDRVKLALKEVVSARTTIEKQRERANRSALDWQRTVNAEAKRLTGLILEVEKPLKDAKASVDDRERLAAEAAAEAVRKEELRKEQEAKAAEQARIREEQAQLAEERRKLAEAQRQMAEQQRRFQAEQQAAREEKEAAERKERERLATVELKRLSDEKEAARVAFLEKIRPDREKLISFANRLHEWWSENRPSELGGDATFALEQAQDAIGDVLAQMTAF